MDQEQIKSLVAGIISSDMSAFHDLFTGCHPALFRYIYIRCRDYDLARDIAQEAFIRIWQNRQRLNPDRSFWSFMVTIAENLLKDHYRHRRVIERHCEERRAGADLFYTPDPGHEVHVQQLQQALVRVINRYLPPRCRSVFMLSRFENKTAPEIAGLLNISIKTVENQLTYALNIIRKKIHKFL
ncbi:MAG TPA: sigma-70 family RNA polymerase sigma factor [bacterium]|nr:sigma-70 family RNA polymerase sigma factor [bacterium]HPN43023.1 sigma-70 family RNA polymerase sigma factor [bacterium]